jgi:hypothetical protein
MLTPIVVFEARKTHSKTRHYRQDQPLLEIVSVAVCGDGENA